MKYSILFPVKDQSELILKNLKEVVIPFFDKQNIDYEILVCLDGSSKEQLQIFNDGVKALPKEIILTPYMDKKGKGHNVNRLIECCNGDYCLFMDADMATDLNVFPLMTKDIGKYTCYIGSRNQKGSIYEKKQTLMRQMMHFVSRKLIRYKFHLKGVRDTQCGFKMFKSDVAKLMITKQTIDGFAFDVEYLYFLSLNGYTIKEYPVIWKDNPASTISNGINEAKRFVKQLKLIKKNKKNYILKEEEKI